MQLPALAVQPPQGGGANDVLSRYAALGQLKANQQKMDLLNRADAREQARLDRLAQLSGGLSQGEPDAIRAYAAMDPDGAKKIFEVVQGLDDAKAAEIERRNAMTTQLLTAVGQQPEAARPLAWNRAREIAQQSGIDLTGVPEQYDPQALDILRMRGMTVDQALEERKVGQKDRELSQPKITTVPGVGLVSANPDTGAASVTMRQQAAPVDPSAAPQVETFYDEATGQSYKAAWDRSKREWVPVGGPKAESGGMRLITNPDGSVEFQMGGPAGGLEKSTRTGLQKDTIAAGDQLARLRAVEDSFNPEFLTFQGKGENWLANVKDQAGFGLDPAEADKLAAYETFRSDAFNNLNRTLQELSGAAVTPQEFDRIQSELPSPKSDGPTAFKAKQDRAALRLKASLLRYQVAQELGLSFDGLNISIANISSREALGKTIDKLGAKLEEKYRSMGVPEAQVEPTVRNRLIEMLGEGGAPISGGDGATDLDGGGRGDLIQSDVPTIASPGDPAFRALPSGSAFRTPDGQLRLKN